MRRSGTRSPTICTMSDAARTSSLASSADRAVMSGERHDRDAGSSFSKLSQTVFLDQRVGLKPALHPLAKDSLSLPVDDAGPLEAAHVGVLEKPLHRDDRVVGLEAADVDLGLGVGPIGG